MFCQQRVDLVGLYSDGHRASEYKPLYGFTCPAAPHTLYLLDINDVILTEVAHLFSWWCTCCRVWSTVLLVQAFFKAVFCLPCLTVYQCVRQFWVPVFFLHTRFHLFRHFWWSKLMRQEHSLSRLAGRFYTDSEDFFCVLLPNKRKEVADRGKPST